MKIIDFDQKFFEYARKWVAKHPNLTEKQIDESYNSMMREWLSTKADWLDGKTPAHYFDGFGAAELLDAMLDYSAADVNLPEPLYRRMVDMGADCEKGLVEILKNEANAESLRTEALGMLRDMGSAAANEYLVSLVTDAQAQNELSEMAADILSVENAAAVDRLMDAYDGASDYAKMLIMDVCVNYAGNDRVLKTLIWRLRNLPEQRALHASYLAKLGDVRALEALEECLKLFDLRYFDYIELRNAVEVLGGDAGEERTFYGDPDYEALRTAE